MIDLMLSHLAKLAVAALIYVVLIVWLLGVITGTNN